MNDLQSDSENTSNNDSLLSKIIQGFHSTFSNEYTFFILSAILIGFFAGLANFVFVAAYEFVYSEVVLPYWGSIAVLIPLLCGGIILFLISFVFSPSEILGFGFPRFLEKINL
ncbi:MAG: hypothetical protein ACE5H1_07605, partial [Thermodesulfobacteriota bacterium]